jgi:siroheme synthase
VLLAASTPGAATWTGTLEALAQAPETDSQDPDAPGTLVIGEVVAVAAQLGLIPTSEAGGLNAGSR